MKTKSVLITGTSTGIGRVTAELFSRRGWNVAATMRRPEMEHDLSQLPGVKIFKLDVLDPESVAQCVSEVIASFGNIDVLVNNAGYAAIGPFEAAGEEQISRQLETNVNGLMRVTRAVLPYFREQRSGTIINIASVAGRITFPMFSLYHTTKWAVEGFSESLRFELQQFNIRVKLIEPGAIKTDFYTRSMDLIESTETNAYDEYSAKVIQKIKLSGRYGAKPEVVARKIFDAANSTSHKFRYPAGGGAGFLLLVSKIIPFRWFAGMIRVFMG
jgi:NAD(P)-dependent dehydrogenase (short-subunit alcohol dehydrogenase family)